MSAVGLPKRFMFVGLEQGLGVHLVHVAGTLQPAHRRIADFYILSLVELESQFSATVSKFERPLDVSFENKGCFKLGNQCKLNS